MSAIRYNGKNVKDPSFGGDKEGEEATGLE